GACQSQPGQKFPSIQVGCRPQRSGIVAFTHMNEMRFELVDIGCIAQVRAHANDVPRGEQARCELLPQIGKGVAEPSAGLLLGAVTTEQRRQLLAWVCTAGNYQVRQQRQRAAASQNNGRAVESDLRHSQELQLETTHSRPPTLTACSDRFRPSLIPCIRGRLRVSYRKTAGKITSDRSDRRWRAGARR